MTTLIASAVVIAGLYFGREVLVPFALAVLLSFLLVPVMRWFYRLRIGRIAAVAITVLVGILAITGFIAVVVAQLAPLVDELPKFQYNIESKISTLPSLSPGTTTLGRVSAVLHDLRAQLARTEAPERERTTTGSRAVPVEIQSPPTTPLETLKTLAGPLLLPLTNAGLVLLFVIWILLNREGLRNRVLALGGGDLHRTTQAMNDAAERVSRYLITQLAINAGCGLAVGVGLAIIGIPFPALWGAMVLLLRFVPYLGIVVAASFPIAIALAVAPGWSLVVWTVLLMLAAETITGNLIEPRFYASTAGLSPLAVVVAAVFWTWLWGPVGLLLSTPLTVCLVVLGQHIPQLAVLGTLFGDEAPLTPEQALYQRLLVGDPEEATEQAEQFIESRSLGEFFDAVAIPALILAQADSDRGVLTAERRAAVAAGIETMLDNLSSDGLDEPPTRTATPTQVLCVPARNELDAAAALLLRHLLRSESNLQAVATVSETTLAEADRQPSAMGEASQLCLSSISEPATPARYVIRRLQRRAPQARLFVGFWGEQAEEPTLSDAIGAALPATIVTSLRDAVREIAAAPANDPDRFGTARPIDGTEEAVTPGDAAAGSAEAGARFAATREQR